MCIWGKWWHRCSCCCVHWGNSSLSYAGGETGETHGTDYWEKMGGMHGRDCVVRRERKRLGHRPGACDGPPCGTCGRVMVPLCCGKASAPSSLAGSCFGSLCAFCFCCLLLGRCRRLRPFPSVCETIRELECPFLFSIPYPSIRATAGSNSSSSNISSSAGGCSSSPGPALPTSAKTAGAGAA